MLKLYAVRREHKKMGFQMAPLTMAVKVMEGMLHRYVVVNGTDCLMPSRKNPLTNEMIAQMLAAPVGAQCAGYSFTVDWDHQLWQGMRATVVVLAETGMRKGDVSKPLKSTPFQRGRLTLDSVRWRIGGEAVAAPSPTQLE